MHKKMREIAELKAKGVSNRGVAEKTGYARNTVNKIVKQINEAGLTYDEVGNLSDQILSKHFNDPVSSRRNQDFFLPNFELLTKELAKPGVTMQLLWEEYMTECRMQKKKGYQLTQFKKHFNDHLNVHQFKDILKRKAGESIEVDWAGQRPHWNDPDTGATVYGYLFVASLSFSGYSFAYVTKDMKLDTWIDCHIKMFQYFDGSAQLLIPDNLKTAVTKHVKDSIILNQTYEDMASYYSTHVLPARVRKPRDKNKVENTVFQCEINLIARLRNKQFFSIDEYNAALGRELERFNHKPFQKKEGNRYELYEQFEKETLNPLPGHPYEMAFFKNAKVQNNSHIAYQKNYYSVPYEYIGKSVLLKVTKNTIHIFHNTQELAAHLLINTSIGQYSTDKDHMPPNSNAYGDWNSTRYLNWARSKGAHVYEVVSRLFQSVKTEQRYYRSVHSLLKLADTYGNHRLESACEYTLKLSFTPKYREIKHILETKQDLSQEEQETVATTSAFLRGGDYFDQ